MCKFSIHILSGRSCTSSLNLITHVQVLHSYIIWPVMYFKSKPDYTCASSPVILSGQSCTSSLNLITHVQVLHSYIIWPVMYFKSKLDYTCASSPFIYNLTGHVTIDHLNIINSTSL
jgi:hypothetical protein